MCLSFLATSMMNPPITRQQDMHFDTSSFATSTAATPIQNDTELSDLVDSVIDLLPVHYQGAVLLPETSSSMSTPNQPQNQEDINKDMAINAITKSLMQIESTGVFNNSPPAYSMHNVNNTQSGQQVSFINKFLFLFHCHHLY